MAERRGARKIISLLLKTGVTVAVIAVIIGKLGWGDIVAAVKKADPQWVVYSLAIFLLSGVLGVVQWKILLANRGIRVAFGRAFSLYFIGMFFNNFILGTIAGDAIRIAYLRAGNGKGKEGFAATFLDRFAGLWAMSGFAVAGCLVLIHRSELGQKAMALTVISLVLMFAAFVGVLCVLLFKKPQAVMFWILDRIPLPQKELIEETIRRTLLETHDLHVMLPVGLLSSVVQFLRIGVHVLCAASLGLLAGHNAMYFFIFVPIIAILMIVPLPFGIKEAAEGMLFAAAGFQPEAAMVFGFLASIIGIVASLLGGVFFIFEGFRAQERKS